MKSKKAYRPTANQNHSMSDHFDPAEQESTEQWGAPSVSINEDVIPDIQADPESAERLAPTPAITKYPDYLLSKFHVDENGNLAPNNSYVMQALKQFNDRGASPLTHDPEGKQISDEQLTEYKTNVAEMAKQLLQFDESAYTSVNDKAVRPSASLIFSFAGAANRLWADWCLDMESFMDIAGKSELDMSEKQLSYKHNLATSLQLQGYNARFARDVLLEMAPHVSNEYKVSQGQVKDAIEYKLRSDAEWQTKQHKRVDISADARRAAPDFDDKLTASF